MRNTLTDEKLAQLVAPFALDDHAQIPDTTTIYLKKSAIRQRLNEVDAGWTLGAPQLLHVADDIVVVTAAMTICGVSRAAVGTGKIQIERWDKEKKQYVPMSITEITREKSKAFKAAASDLTARGAMQFGVGEYLKNIPKSVRDMATLERWLNTLNQPAEPQHWALNGGGKRFQSAVQSWGLKWEQVRDELEPNVVLNRLSDTKLSEDEALRRLMDLALEQRVSVRLAELKASAGDSESPLSFRATSTPINS